MSWRAAPVVALALLPGCFFFGGCGLSPESASWDDPRLFAAMPPPGSLGNATSTWTQPEPGLPFARSMDPAWGPHNLTHVARMSGTTRFEQVTVTLSPDRLSTSRDNMTPEAEIAQELRTFVANVSALTASEVDAYVEAMLRNATEQDEGGYSEDADGNLVRLRSFAYSAPPPPKLRLAELLQRLEQVGAAEVHFASVLAGPWSFGFSVERRALAADDGSWRLEVVPSGHAEFHGLGRGERPQRRYEADVKEVLDAHGLPQPDDMHVGGSIC